MSYLVPNLVKDLDALGYLLQGTIYFNLKFPVRPHAAGWVMLELGVTFNEAPGVVLRVRGLKIWCFFDKRRNTALGLAQARAGSSKNLLYSQQAGWRSITRVL